MSKKRISSDTIPLSSNPFGALADLRDALPAGDGPEPVHAVDAAVARVAASTRAVIRYQRKGRGGKEVTLVEKLDLSPDEAADWCRDLKRALGCGGQVEGDTLVFAGDQRDRLRPLLERRGVAKIAVS